MAPRVSVPEPLLVRPPIPEMVFETVVPPAPATVRRFPPLLMLPDRVSALPLSDVMVAPLAVEPTAITAPNVFVPVLDSSAPVAPAALPVPLRVSVAVVVI